MNNQTILITGATSGIGKETAIQLAKTGAKIVFNARNEERGATALKDIISASGNDSVSFEVCNLSSFASIRTFANAIAEQYEHLDVLINNAGVWEDSRAISQDGIERTWAVNHLAPFLLTNLLLPLLKKAEGARIVTVSSALHPRGVIQFDNLELATDYSAMKAYANSKLANILFTRELAKRLSGTDITANCLHPGVISTSLARDANIFMRMFFKIIGKKASKGAETSVYLAISPEVEGVTGEYFQDSAPFKSASASKDMEVAAQLWTVSEQMCGRV